MFFAIVIVHVLVSIFLVFVVLLQTGRGAELGAAFGGMGQATFGRGQSTFITKFTTALAVIFMTTSLSLAFLSSEQPGRSVISTGPPPAQSETARQDQAQEQGAVQTGAPVQPLEQTTAPPNPNAQPAEKQ